MDSSKTKSIINEMINVFESTFLNIEILYKYSTILFYFYFNNYEYGNI